jgi:Matrixin
MRPLCSPPRDLRRRASRPAGLASAAALAIATLVCPAQARAFCREVTTSPPKAYDPAANGCFTGSGESLPTLFWRNQCVGYSLQRNASRQVSLADATRVAEEAFAAWSGASCAQGGSPSILPSAFPAVSCNAVPSQEHNNPIIFHDDSWPYSDSSNAIGFTTLTVDLTTGDILGATIEINSANFTIVADPPAPTGAYDLASILTHEAGHFLGLAHSASASAVMNAFYKPGSNVLSADDVAGICAIYSPDGSRSTQNGSVAGMTCDPQPPEGFTDGCGALDAGSAVGFGGPPTTGDGQATSDGGGPATCTFNVLSCAVGAVGSRAPSSGAGLLVVVLAGGGIVRRSRRGKSPESTCALQRSYFFSFS